MKHTDLASFSNDSYQPGPAWKRGLWYITSLLFFQWGLNPSSRLKVFWLRLFGAKVGRGVVIKPRVTIKYPWKLSIGDHCWIGEQVWIDNLDKVSLEDHVCISQGALLLCGNHNYKLTSFDLMTSPISIKSGAWVGAKSKVAPGVTMHTHAVLTLGSVALTDLEAYGVYSGHPAKKVKTRTIVS